MHVRKSNVFQGDYNGNDETAVIINNLNNNKQAKTINNIRKTTL